MEERDDLLHAVLQVLPERSREILARYYVRDEAIEEICSGMGLTEAQFRVLKARAIARLKDTILNDKPKGRESARDSVSTTSFDRVLPVIAHAVAVFGDEQKASHWLRTRLELLDNQTPAEVLSTGAIQRVDRILTRIEHNIPS